MGRAVLTVCSNALASRQVLPGNLHTSPCADAYSFRASCLLQDQARHKGRISERALLSFGSEISMILGVPLQGTSRMCRVSCPPGQKRDGASRTWPGRPATTREACFPGGGKGMWCFISVPRPLRLHARARQRGPRHESALWHQLECRQLAMFHIALHKAHMHPGLVNEQPGAKPHGQLSLDPLHGGKQSTKSVGHRF